MSTTKKSVHPLRKKEKKVKQVLNKDKKRPTIYNRFCKYSPDYLKREKGKNCPRGFRYHPGYEVCLERCGPGLRLGSKKIVPCCTAPKKK